MSYKLKKITFMNKKPTLKMIDFTASHSNFTDVFVPEKKQNNFMKRVLKGKEKIAHGRYQIDGQDLVGARFARSKIEIIGPDKWLDRLIPLKLILYSSLLFDLKFVRQARINTIDKKFDYYSFKDSKNDLEDMHIRRKIDGVIAQFINDATNAEVDLLDEYFAKIDVINEEKSKEIFKNYYVQIQVLARKAASLKEELANAQLLLTFYQSLWDKIYSFDEFRNACTCEYNVKASSNRIMKKDLYKFKFSQPHFMVAKQLKLINIRTSELRLQIYRVKKMSRWVNKQLNIEINKYHRFNKISKIQQQELYVQRNEWKQLLEYLRTDFTKQQKEIFFDILANESLMVGKQIIFLTHEYHTKVLTSEVNIGNENEFKILKKHYKKDIQSLYAQIKTWTNENIKALNMKFDWYLKNNFKLSSLNMIYVKILKAINMERQNIIFVNRLGLLSNKDIMQLKETIVKVTKKYPKTTFIAVTDNIQDVFSFARPIHAPNKQKEIIAMSPSKLYVENAKMLRDSWFSSWNIVNYRKVDQGIEIERKVWNVENPNFKRFGKIFINPFEITTKEVPDVNGQLPFVVKIKATNKFIDKNIHLGITKRGYRLLFYSTNKFEVNKEYVIYAQATAIADIF